MRKLKISILVSFLMAGISSFFLYESSAVRAVELEPVATAAQTDYTEQFTEAIVIEETGSSTVPAHRFDSEDKNDGEPKTGGGAEPAIQATGAEPKNVLQTMTLAKTARAAELIEMKLDEDTSKAVEQEIHTLSNKERRVRGLDAYTFDETLAKIARKRSEDMLTRDYFSHTSPDGCGLTCNFAASGYASLMWGENIARYKPFNEMTADIVAEVFLETWVESSGHRDNLLSEEFTHHGVGIAIHDETIIATVIFANPK